MLFYKGGCKLLTEFDMPLNKGTKKKLNCVSKFFRLDVQYFARDFSDGCRHIYFS